MTAIPLEKQSDLIPQPDPNFFDNTSEYATAEKIIDSKKFFPVWITGPKGCGKSSTIKQICAVKKREFIRVNFNQETDESELFGSIELIEENGATVTKFNEGPVLEAMRKGAILLLDEIDVAHPNKVLCLQSVLEGQPAFVKSQKMIVEPADGFQIFATSNTKGHGCETGEYMGTNTMNGAFLDRFAITIEQNYPEPEAEANLLRPYYAEHVWRQNDKTRKEDITAEEREFSKDFLVRLSKFAAHVRNANDTDAFDDVISTRTLINIVKCYGIFEDEIKSIEMSCSRFNEADKLALLEIYRNLFDVGNSKTLQDEVAEYVSDDLTI